MSRLTTIALYAAEALLILAVVGLLTATWMPAIWTADQPQRPINDGRRGGRGNR